MEGKKKRKGTQYRISKRSLRRQNVSPTSESKPDTSSWHCAVCNQSFQAANELSYHHMTHTVLELSQALTEAQKKTKPDVVPEESGVDNDDTEASADCDLGGSVREESNTPAGVLPKKRGRPKKYDNDTTGHTCDVCGKTLSSRSNLTKHKVIHSQDKPYECEECGVKFNQNRDLKTHMMQKHTLERPHICKVCGKGFVHKFYLQEHLDYHSGDRRFQCSTCGKQFQSTSALNKHVQRHETVRNFACDICPKTFIVKSDLKAHVRLVHEKQGNTGIPVYPARSNRDPSLPAPIPPNYVPVEEHQASSSTYSSELKLTYPVYEKPVPALRMVKEESHPLAPHQPESSKQKDDKERQKELESQQIEEFMMSLGVRIPDPVMEPDLLPEPASTKLPSILPIHLASLTPTPPSQLGVFIPNVPPTGKRGPEGSDKQ